MNFLTHFGVLVCMIVTDFVWAQYISATAAKQIWRASGMSMLIILVGGLVTTAYVNNPIYLIPAAAGAFVGTFISVWREKQK